VFCNCDGSGFILAPEKREMNALHTQDSGVGRIRKYSTDNIHSNKKLAFGM
jgi:hypothetical protein